jgi:RNA-directed DNA polymerase
VLSPLIFNVAMSVLDEHLQRPWKPGGVMETHGKRGRRRAKGLPNWRIVRYADDFVVLVHGTGTDVEALREEIAQVLAPLGLRLSPAKTRIVHMSEGFDFLGYADAPAMPRWARGPSLTREHSFPARHNRTLLRAG